MDIVQLALFKLAKKEAISVTEFRVLSALRKKPQDFLDLAESTDTIMLELEEILSEFQKKKIVKEQNGKYSIDALKVLDGMITETETIKELA